MDAVKLIGLFLIGLALPFALAGIWIWFWVWVTIALVIGAYEIYAIYFSKEKKTISKIFWDWKKQHPKLCWILAAGYILFFGYLFTHLWLHW